MGLHAFAEYLKYKWKAKGRHGTHSPFVYAMVEDVLQGKAEKKHGEGKYEQLLSAIMAYYNYSDILDLNVGFDIPQSDARSLRSPSKGDLDVVVFPETLPEDWIAVLHKYISVMENGGVLAVPGIHKAKEYTKNWDRLCAEGGVKLSIDLYGLGLLFSKGDFKEKQHFVLKTPSP